MISPKPQTNKSESPHSDEIQEELIKIEDDEIKPQTELKSAEVSALKPSSLDSSFKKTSHVRQISRSSQKCTAKSTSSQKEEGGVRNNGRHSKKSSKDFSTQKTKLI